jgi:hypothetical protein
LAYAAVGCVSKTENEKSAKSGGRRSTMPFTVTDFTVDTNSITITFSDTVLQGSQNGADQLTNYSVFAPRSVDLVEPPPTTLQDVTEELKGTSFNAKPNVNGNIVTFQFTPSGGRKEFQPGDFVHLVVRNVQSAGSDPLDGGSAVTGTTVRGRVGRMTRDVEDAISYPVLTEEVGYRPSPVGIPTGGGSGISGSGVGGLGQVAAKAVSEVLGWKPNSSDPKGFVGALTQAFTLTDVEGHVESTWTPRTYAVQTDLGGGITGAQASLYMRAKNALDSALPLLDGLYPLDPEADPEYVKALREMARSQMTEIVKELGTVGLPSILRIDTYFGILLGQNPAPLSPSGPVQFDPDEIEGTLGQLRDTYGIKFVGNKFNNSVEDEQDITNFRVISDYMTSLMQSWIANRQFFFVNPGQQAFFGTQLVLISRQFTTISETVNEVRFALDSVFIGPSERQTLLLRFADTTLAPMFLEDVLGEVERFFGDEASRLLRDGGKISVTNNILPVVQSLHHMVDQAHAPLNIGELPDGFKTARVHNALDDLQDQLEALVELIEQVEQQVPPSEDKLTISGVSLRYGPSGKFYTLSITGTGIEADAEVILHSTVMQGTDVTKEFYSAQRIDVTFDPSLLGPPATHGIEIKNPDGESAILENAFSVQLYQGHHIVQPLRPPTGKTGLKSRKKYRFGISIGGGIPIKPASPPPAPPININDANALKKSIEGDIKKSHNDLQAQIQQTQTALWVEIENQKRLQAEIQLAVSTLQAEIQQSHQELYKELREHNHRFEQIMERMETKGKTRHA